jgi:hypothetical protein
MENGAPQNEGRDPSGFLSQIIGNAVTVKLNSGVVYKGEWNRGLLDLSLPPGSYPSSSCADADHPRQASFSPSMGT